MTVTTITLYLFFCQIVMHVAMTQASIFNLSVEILYRNALNGLPVGS